MDGVAVQPRAGCIYLDGGFLLSSVFFSFPELGNCLGWPMVYGCSDSGIKAHVYMFLGEDSFVRNTYVFEIQKQSVGTIYNFQSIFSVIFDIRFSKFSYLFIIYNSTLVL